eukprot:TRINITY_DN1892_c0_g1_i1.p1 TRINITY_DN1892_c0_g1~~TRINITY_DN1892_c0_g1_i1.p1  ORF type:complete len:248 (-),score=39.53 TRINITY_DN1892_c0_g1_i1:87-830(-)
MQFHTEPSSGHVALANSVLVIPSLTIGNVGQLAVDILINTFELNRIGFLDHKYVLPVIGNDAFTPNGKGVLSTNLELYHNREHNLTVIQQRAPIVKGRSKDFTHDLVEWIRSKEFKTVVLLHSADAAYRIDRQMFGGQLRYFGEFSADLLVKLEGGTIRLEDETIDSTLRKGSYSRSLLEALSLQKIPVLGLMTFCNEGDNIVDAINIAEWVNFIFQFRASKDRVQWKFPESWRLLQGDAFDQSLYL